MYMPHLKLTVLSLVALFCASLAHAYDVERGSNNTLYLLLLNDNPGAVYHEISIGDSKPGFVLASTATIVPAQINGGSSDLAVVDFDVSPLWILGDTGNLEVTVSGLAAGNPINVVFNVPLTVVDAGLAPAAQGFVGTGIPAPDPGGTDTDGDGVPDSLETAYGSDPNSASSLPGQVDTDGDGIEDGSDPAPADPCIPSVFNGVCTTDTDGDGDTDGAEGEFADGDGDGTPDYQESAILDDDNDGLSNEADSSNGDPCVPSVFNGICATDTDGDGDSDGAEGQFTDGDGDGTPDWQESAIVDDDGDGLSNEADSNNADPCLPTVFNGVCTTDTDGDGKTDGTEGELTDTDADGTPDYQESSILDDDSDGVSNELDPNNSDPCVPDGNAAACLPSVVAIPVFGPAGYLVLGLLLTALGATQLRQSKQRGDQS